MSRKKGKRTALQENVVATNRWGCGCFILAFLGLIVAMLASGIMQ